MNILKEDNTILPTKNYPQIFDTASTTNTNCEPNNCGQPKLDPIWIQPSDDPWSEMSFDPPFGLQSIMSPIPTQTIHHQPEDQLLEDSDLLVPLPDPDAIHSINPISFLSTTNNVLDELTPNPIPGSSKQYTGRLSKPAPPFKKTTKLPTRKQSCARTYHQQPQQKQNNTLPQPNPVQVKQKKIQRVSPTKKKVTSMLTKDTQTWVSIMAKSTQTLVDCESNFINAYFKKIYAIMKKLDTTNPLFATPPSQALKVAQERQQLLQAFNIIHANVNKLEASATFALYHRYPFPPYIQP